MRENVIFRFNEHQIMDGVQEYSIEIAMPGQYSTTIIGASREELLPQMQTTIEQLFVLLKVPSTVKRVKEAESRMQGNSFAGDVDATFSAEVYRNGHLVE